MSKNDEITCSIEFTEGAVDRITEAFVDLYYGIKNGLHTGPLLDDAKEEEKPA